MSGPGSKRHGDRNSRHDRLSHRLPRYNGGRDGGRFLDQRGGRGDEDIFLHLCTVTAATGKRSPAQPCEQQRAPTKSPQQGFVRTGIGNAGLPRLNGCRSGRRGFRRSSDRGCDGRRFRRDRLRTFNRLRRSRPRCFRPRRRANRGRCGARTRLAGRGFRRSLRFRSSNRCIQPLFDRGRRLHHRLGRRRGRRYDRGRHDDSRRCCIGSNSFLRKRIG